MKRAFDIVVVGAGPAGLAGASAAARAGMRVAVIDENPRMGGQIWRAGVGTCHTNYTKVRAIASFKSSGAELYPGYQVVDSTGEGDLVTWIDVKRSLETFGFKRLIIATGARERFLPFPGWTLPGVFGAGGLQALVRTGYNITGKRVVIAGTGPLLLAVAAHLKQAGAQIVSINEQAPMSRLIKFGFALMGHPRKIFQGIGYRTQLAGSPYRTGTWAVEAEGNEKLTGIQLSDGRRTWTEPCDLMACGFHLVPNTELSALLGCRIVDGVVQVDENQQTSIESVYCAGEPTGIAGVDAALLQGEIAGLAASGMAQKAIRLHRKRSAEGKFGRAMGRAFALRPELFSLAKPDTIACRCEDVRFGQVSALAVPQTDWTYAKLQTRCGMGSCQGRVCGPALEAIFGWRNNSVRSPLFPIPVAAMCSEPPCDKEISIPVPQENLR
jgi:D-hydroxyproline dehydrogenase subunit alpha